MVFLYLKALHIIFVVTWFAGLFYNVRLFIYYAEAQEKEERERLILTNQYKVMSARLWHIITWPSAVLTLIFGFSLLHQYLDNLPKWLIIKLILLLGLYVYHFLSYMIHRQLQKGIINYSSAQLRIWNEVATLFLFSIVFLVILRDTLNMVWGVVGLIGLSILLMIGIKAYKKIRQKNT
ncbi:MAG: CopD family protein [Cytophagales bacterium]|nr:CopD family protein [Cytophagales bacterium]